MSSIKFSSLGAYLTSWQINGCEVLYQGSETKRTGIPLLFPNFDAGAPLPSHGFGRISQWQIINQSSNSCHLRLTHQDISEEFQKLYPHHFSADLQISAIDNYLDYQLTVANVDDNNMPVAPGLHPYWPVAHSQKPQIKLIDFPQFDPQAIDWDNNPPNSLYNFSGHLDIVFPEYKLTITDLTPEHYFRHLQIWSQNTSWPDFNYVCFEPVTRPPEGITSDPILITPGKSVEFKIKFIYSLK